MALEDYLSVKIRNMGLNVSRLMIKTYISLGIVEDPCVLKKIDYKLAITYSMLKNEKAAKKIEQEARQLDY